MSHQSLVKSLAVLSLSGLLLAACSDTEAPELTDENTQQTDVND